MNETKKKSDAMLKKELLFIAIFALAYILLFKVAAVVDNALWGKYDIGIGMLLLIVNIPLAALLSYLLTNYFIPKAEQK